MEMNLETLREKRAEDVNNGKNSLSWIVPIAKNVLSRMTSDELYFFIVDQVVHKKDTVEHQLLNIPDETN